MTRFKVIWFIAMAVAFEYKAQARSSVTLYGLMDTCCCPLMLLAASRDTASGKTAERHTQQG